MSQENVESTRAIVEAWNRKDFAGGWDLCDPGMVVDRSNSMVEPGIYRGRDEAEQFLVQWAGSWSEFRWEIDEYIDAGDDVVAIGRFHGTGATSGAVVEANFCQVFSFNGRKAAYVKLFQNRSDALAAAGVEAAE